MLFAQTDPESGGENAKTLKDYLDSLLSALRRLEGAERMLDEAKQKVNLATQELRLGELQGPFVVELFYPYPDADAYVVLDERIVEEKPGQFVATEVFSVGNGKTEFEDRRTGRILRVQGGYNYEFSLPDGEGSVIPTDKNAARLGESALGAVKEDPQELTHDVDTGEEIDPETGMTDTDRWLNDTNR